MLQGLAVIGALVLSLLPVAPVAAANPSATLDQCANGADVATRTCGCNVLASDWVNGNLGASKSAYLEGDSIPYRMLFDHLAPGGLTGGVHTVTIEWDT